MLAAYETYRMDLDFRQSIRALMYASKAWSTPRGLLLVGDSRIWALRCDDELAGWRTLNLGNSGMTAQMLGKKLRSWLGHSVAFERAAVWIGVNDILHHNRSPHEVAVEIGLIAGELESRASRVAVFDQIPVLGDKDKAAITNNALVELQKYSHARLARRENVDSLNLWPIDESAIRLRLYSDSIHLSAEGNRYVCGRLSRWLAES